MLASLLILDALITLVMVLAVVRRTDSPGALPYLGLLSGVLLYNFGYALELMTPPGAMSVFWNHFQYWGVATVPAFWLWMAVETPQQRKLRSWPKLGALFTIPAITLVLNLTNDWHHLYYLSQTYERVGAQTIGHLVRGPWYYVQAGFAVVIYLVVPIIFAVRWRKLERGYGRLALGMYLGALFYVVAVALYQFGWALPDYDLAPVGMTASILTYYFVLWPARLFEMIPLSREMVFRVIPEPVLVTDRQSRLVDWNPAAVGLFPALKGARAGWALERVVVERSWRETLEDGTFEQPVVLAQGTPTPEYWSITPTPVEGSSGRPQGRVFVFRNVTDLVAKNTLLERLDMTDPETGLFKEAAFRERAHTQVQNRSKRGEPVSLILLELPDVVPMQVLRATTVWSGLVGRTDLLARLSDRRFAVLTPGMTPARALSLAETLCTQLHPFHLRPIFGVAGILKTESGDLDKLWRRAESALQAVWGRENAVGCFGHEDTLENTCLDEGDPL